MNSNSLDLIFHKNLYLFIFFLFFFQTIRCFEQSKMNKTSSENKLGIGNAKNHFSRIKVFSIIKGLKVFLIKRYMVRSPVLPTHL